MRVINESAGAAAGQRGQGVHRGGGDTASAGHCLDRTGAGRWDGEGVGGALTEEESVCMLGLFLGNMPTAEGINA